MQSAVLPPDWGKIGIGLVDGDLLVEAPNDTNLTQRSTPIRDIT